MSSVTPITNTSQYLALIANGREAAKRALSEMSPESRLRFAFDMRRAILAQEEIPDDLLALAVEALQLNRTAAFGGKKASDKAKAAPAQALTVDDL